MGKKLVDKNVLKLVLLENRLGGVSLMSLISMIIYLCMLFLKLNFGILVKGRFMYLTDGYHRPMHRSSINPTIGRSLLATIEI